ncbi:MAG: hypothetical protein F6K46_03370 [Moorea sp. SIO3E8]|nr:hypothetical protein [Moorena sp. SIO3E8]
MGRWGIRSVFPIPNSRFPFPSWEGLGVGSDSRLPTPNSFYLFQILLLDWRYIENIAVIAPKKFNYYLQKI